MPALRSWLLLAQLQTQTEALAARGRMPSLADRRAISEAECRTCLLGRGARFEEARGSRAEQ